VWAGGKVSAQRAAALDRSKSSNNDLAGDHQSNNSNADRELDQSRATYLPSEGEKPMWETEEEEGEQFREVAKDESVESSNDTSSSWNFNKSFLGGILQTITGGKSLEAEDLAPVMTQMKEILHEKNVAVEIANDICSSVEQSLVGYKMASFTRIQTVVVDALCEAVQRVLTPRASTDVLRQVLDAKAQNKVFSMVFVGINGVGKSTSLAKTAYYLKQHGVNVLLAACDTFRSGAVEQLRTHSRCLEAPLFEMGYSKDPSNVAKRALAYAQENNFDCVLIDTAGRMQNNEPLMRALATLVSDNSPNLVLFVGEALVGNDGIDQLTMFDRALVNYSPPGCCHRIDGIILTKFDTIDDKVGAALSMSYKSGAPIVFVGTGQKYTHLKKLNVATVIKHLFSK
jgi:signal recognition particle receptor subunit alpha